LLQLALSAAPVRPRVINVDGHPAYATAITESKESGELSSKCRCRPSPYLNNIIEQDHRFVKKRITVRRTAARNRGLTMRTRLTRRALRERGSNATPPFVEVLRRLIFLP
jgi:transposase-like protein